MGTIFFLFFLLFVFSTGALLVAVINPRWVKVKNRRRSTLLYGSSSFLSLIISAITKPEETRPKEQLEQQQTQQANNSVEVETIESTGNSYNAGLVDIPIDEISNGMVIYAQGRRSPGDLGGGEFYADLSDTNTTTDDNVISFKIAGDASNGHWKRTNPFQLTPQMAGAERGATDYPSFDSQPAFQKLINSITAPQNGLYSSENMPQAIIWIPPGFYHMTAKWKINIPNISIEGYGAYLDHTVRFSNKNIHAYGIIVSDTPSEITCFEFYRGQSGAFRDLKALNGGGVGFDLAAGAYAQVTYSLFESLLASNCSNHGFFTRPGQSAETDTTPSDGDSWFNANTVINCASRGNRGHAWYTESIESNFNGRSRMNYNTIVGFQQESNSGNVSFFGNDNHFFGGHFVSETNGTVLDAGDRSLVLGGRHTNTVTASNKILQSPSAGNSSNSGDLFQVRSAGYFIGQLIVEKAQSPDNSQLIKTLNGGFTAGHTNTDRSDIFKSIIDGTEKWIWTWEDANTDEGLRIRNRDRNNVIRYEQNQDIRLYGDIVPNSGNQTISGRTTSNGFENTDTNRLSLSGDLTLSSSDSQVENIDPNGATRAVTLPTEKNGIHFEIGNRATIGSGYDLNIKNSVGTSLLTVNPQQIAKFTCDGTGWMGQLSTGVVT